MDTSTRWGLVAALAVAVIILYQEHFARPRPPVQRAEQSIAVSAAPKVIPAATSSSVEPTDRDAVTKALNSIFAMPSDAAARKAETLRAASKKASGTNRLAAALLMAAALERGTDLAGAKAAYRALANEGPGTPYAATARFREETALGVAGEDARKAEATYELIAAQPEVEGWFVVDGRWTWTDSRRAALQALVEIRSDQLSFRFLSFLRSQSPFSAPYAYLFVLFALGVGVKIIELPLLVRGARIGANVRRLAPQVTMIQSQHSHDLQTMQREIMALYGRHGVNPFSGCLVAIPDLIFVIWALTALVNFGPQLALDNAGLWWVSDVAQFDGGILAAWATLGAVQAALTTPAQRPQQRALLFVSAVVGMGVLGCVGWYWRWPAIVFIFWGMLSILSLVIGRGLMMILQTRA